MLKAALCLLLLSTTPVFSQKKVDSRNIYPRMYAIVGLQGKGTLSDPKRPMYVPASIAPNTRKGILGFSYVLSDDGTKALVEFLAADRSAFAPILADTNPTTKTFEKGRARREDIEAAFGQYKRNFTLERFPGVRMP